MAEQIEITRPDGWHLHLRDGGALRAVLPHTARQFGRAIVMPNLKPPVTTAAQALAYRERIRAALPAGMVFEPLMTLYLTDTLPPDEIARARAALCCLPLHRNPRRTGRRFGCRARQPPQAQASRRHRYRQWLACR